jgi:hypothetical protein
VTRVLEMARDWGLGMLAFGLVAVSACVGGWLIFVVVRAALPPRPAEDGDEL